ncbi:MAG TPA: hypothetical protein VEA41_04125 [Salinarimonas sp.]|nr:hypothetical protein [Salinarimonas sp.]
MPRLPTLLVATFVASFGTTLALDATGAPRRPVLVAQAETVARAPSPAIERKAEAPAPPPSCRPVRVVHQGLGEAAPCR